MENGEGQEIAQLVDDIVLAKAEAAVGANQIAEDEIEAARARTEPDEPGPLDDPPRAMVIGISGRARSGNDSVAQAIARFYPAALIGFADPIRAFVSVLCGFNKPGQLEAQKEIPSDMLGGQTPRYAMQTLGTEWGRQLIDPNLWVRQAVVRAGMTQAHGAIAIIADVRFENEAAAIREIGGTVIHITRPGAPSIDNAGHASESGIAYAEGDMRIENSGTIDDLNAKVKTLLEELYGVALDDERLKAA